MTEPVIYTKSYVSSDDLFSVSSGPTAIANIYDRDVDSKWSSSGANSDLTDVTIDVTFYEGSVAVSRTIDRLILLNHNIKAYDVYYWDGSAFQSWLAVSGAAEANSVKTLGSQTISKARLVLHTTQAANQEKYIGEMVFCALQLDIGQDLFDYQVEYQQNVRDARGGDGSYQRKVKPWSPNRFEKYAARCSFQLIPKATLDSLLGIKKTGQPFLWQPESSARPDQLFLVTWLDPIRYRYVDQYKTAGFEVEFSVQEK